jgi:hypothetical protein
MSFLGTLLGGAAGFLIGGPMGAAVGAGLGSGVDASNAASSAASTQAGAANNATQAQLDMFKQMRGDLKPYMDQGTLSLADLNKLMANPSMVTQLPGYEFQMDQGMGAIENSAAAKGLTGNTLKDLNTFGQGMASNYYNDYWKKLFDMMTTGQDSAAGVGQAGINTGTNIGNNMIGAGNALAAGQVGSANALAGGISNSLPWLMQAMNSGGGTQAAAPIVDMSVMARG